MRLRYFGHACVLVQTAEVSILFDPVTAVQLPLSGKYTVWVSAGGGGVIEATGTARPFADPLVYEVTEGRAVAHAGFPRAPARAPRVPAT